MIRPKQLSPTYYAVCRLLLFFVAASASFNGYYDKWHFREPGVHGHSLAASFDRIVDGTADRPFIFRQLIPTLSNEIDQRVPSGIKDRVFNARTGEKRLLDAMFDSPMAKDSVYFFRYLVFYALTFLFAQLAIWCMYLVCREAGLGPLVSVLAPIAVTLLIPYIMSQGGSYYDFPEFAFLALAISISFRHKWWWIIPVAALGTWNKESFLLAMPTLYPFFRRHQTRNAALLGTGVLFLVCAAVYYPIRLHYAHNGGGPMEFHLYDQVVFFLHPQRLVFDLDRTYGAVTPSAFTVLPLALLVWTAVRGWSELPAPVKMHAKIAAAINIPLFLAFCHPGELRNLSLLFVVFLLMVACNLAGWIRQSEPTPSPVPTTPS